MKKYLKMTFAALSAIVLNFSCLAMDVQLNDAPEQKPNKVIHIYNDTSSRDLTPLSTEEQISLLKIAISTSNLFLVENILAGHIGKIDQKYHRTARGKDNFAPMPDERFEELQQLSVEMIPSGAKKEIGGFFDPKIKIFELITAKFFKVTNNKEHAYQTTTSTVYHNLKRFNLEALGLFIELFPSPISKKEFVEQLLNYAKRDNNTYEYGNIFWALEITYISPDIRSSSLPVFTNQPWLQPFIREYLEQALRVGSDKYKKLEEMPIGFIKKVAPDLYNERLPLFLKRCIIDAADTTIVFLLPLDEDTSLPSESLRLSAGYLNLALEKYHSGTILSHIASYTDTSSDLTNVVQTLANIPQEKCQAALESIKDVNSCLHNLLLEKLQSLGH